MYEIIGNLKTLHWMTLQEVTPSLFGVASFC